RPRRISRSGVARARPARHTRRPATGPRRDGERRPRPAGPPPDPRGADAFARQGPAPRSLSAPRREVTEDGFGTRHDARLGVATFRYRSSPNPKQAATSLS